MHHVPDKRQFVKSSGKAEHLDSLSLVYNGVIGLELIPGEDRVGGGRIHNHGNPGVVGDLRRLNEWRHGDLELCEENSAGLDHLAVPRDIRSPQGAVSSCGDDDCVFPFPVNGDEGGTRLAGDGAHVADVDPRDFQFAAVGCALLIRADCPEEDDLATLKSRRERLIGSFPSAKEIEALCGNRLTGRGQTLDTGDVVDIERADDGYLLQLRDRGKGDDTRISAGGK